MPAAVASKQADTVARCLLLSDGQANQGITNYGELQRLSADWARQGIVTTTLGMGEDFDEQLMTAMAVAGGGHGYFIRETRQTGDLLTSIIGEALEVVASGVTLVVELPSGMEAEVLGAFTSDASAGGLRVSVGQLVSGQELPNRPDDHVPDGAGGAVGCAHGQARGSRRRARDRRGASRVDVGIARGERPAGARPRRGRRGRTADLRQGAEGCAAAQPRGPLRRSAAGARSRREAHRAVRRRLRRAS